MRYQRHQMLRILSCLVRREIYRSEKLKKEGKKKIHVIQQLNMFIWVHIYVYIYIVYFQSGSNPNSLAFYFQIRVGQNLRQTLLDAPRIGSCQLNCT